MKIGILLIALLGLGRCDDSWDLQEYGLCIGGFASCPTRIQRYGVCCRLNGVTMQFANGCAACSAGCEKWKYKRSITQQCK